MARDLVSVDVRRRASAPDGAGGYTQTESSITGSPFEGRIYRRTDGASGFTADALGETDVDRGVVVSFQDSATPVELNDILVIADEPRLRVTRVRRYTRHSQCDVVAGVE